MYDLLKQIAADNSWVFEYARRDFSNLYDEVPQVGVPHIFLDPVQVDNTYGDYNTVESKTYSGSFMILASSDIDEIDYDTRYQTYIKPILDNVISVMNTAFQCEDMTIQTWRTVEIINALDYNFDGVVVTYTINQDV